MRAIVLVFGVLICAIYLFHSTKAAPGAAVAALEVEEEGAQLAGLDAAAPAAELNRQKRATCDLLSGLGVNHSACALHCLFLGRGGGYCNGRGVCICR